MEYKSEFQEMFDTSTYGKDAASVGEQLETELARLRKKDRRSMLVIGILSALMIAGGTVMYVTGDADSASLAKLGAYNGSGVTYADYSRGTGNGSGPYGSSSGTSGLFAGESCCGSGATGGAVSGKASLAGLEKQAVAQYAKETGKSDVKAKANDFGCHIQIDVSDAGGKVVRSYGYQGGPLYVIQ